MNALLAAKDKLILETAECENTTNNIFCFKNFKEREAA
jgi:hypothetical protein